MEKYQIVASCTNNSTTRMLDWIPENFQGVKITQKFSWINPIGYTPKYSIETMRVIKKDKAWMDAIFAIFGLQSVVLFAIYKLNASATDYDLISTFKVDFESFEISNYFSEFALKSNSCIDNYNDTKNTAQNFSNALSVIMPTTQNFINYVSLLYESMFTFFSYTKAVFNMRENESPVIYNSEYSLLYRAFNAYSFVRIAPSNVDIMFSAKCNFTIDIDPSIIGTKISLNIYRDVYNPNIPPENQQIPDFSNIVHKIAEVNESGVFKIDVPLTKISGTFETNDILFIGVEVNNASVDILSFTGSFGIEFYINTELPANTFARKINYITSETVINQIFNNQATIQNTLRNIGVTSALSILKKQDYVSLIPKDFMTDFCLATGTIVNFKKDGTVKIDKISTYFNTLLNISNAVEVTSFKDVMFSYATELNFKSVSVGMEQKEYEVYTYFHDWNKIITFTQIDRTASENLDLSLTKYRVDFSGILDYVNKLSNSPANSSNDMFFFNPFFTSRSTNEGAVYDIYTPRDILENWRKFLEFCFYNYSFDTLVLTSDGGDPFDLNFYGYKQFDDFVFTGYAPKILPRKITFTALIDELDFTEKILKIVHNGIEYYIFVTEAETTDNLREQKIKGNLIEF